MDPIADEYLNTVELVKKELESFKQDQNDLKQKISSFYHKNKIWINDLRKSTLISDHDLSGVQDLEYNLSLAVAAKEKAILLWQEAMQQLEKLEDQLVGSKSLVETERQKVLSSIGQFKEQYQKGVSAELLNYNSNLSNAKQELQKKCLELEQKKVEVKNLTEELHFSQTQLSALSLEKSELQEKVNSLQQALSDTNNLLSTTKKELDKVNLLYSELSALSADLKEQNKILKHNALVLEKDAKESLFAAQEAILQRKEMAYREEQYIKEIEMLKSSCGIDVQKVELRCNLKIKELQEQNSEHIKILMTEIEELHKDNGLKQGLFEKAEREKKALQSKLELLCAETSPTNSTLLDDLCNRLVLAEKTRDEFELQVKSLQSDLEEIQSNKEQDTKRFKEEKTILKERLSNLSKEFRQFLSDKIKLNEELCNLKKKCQELEKQLTFKQATQVQEISAIKHEADQKQQFFNEMLHLVENQNKTVCRELQTLLESQFNINRGWKEETDLLISQSETKIVELCDTIAQLQYQNNKLAALLQENRLYNK